MSRPIEPMAIDTTIRIVKDRAMRIIRMTMENELVERVDARVKRLGTTRSAFTRQALRDALRRLDEKELEERHVEGYRRDPAQPGEFEVPEADHAWGDDAWSADQSTP